MTKFQKIQLIDSGDDVIQIDKSRIVKLKSFSIRTKTGVPVACARGVGELKGSIALDEDFDYVLTKDSVGIPCLVVLEKE